MEKIRKNCSRSIEKINFKKLRELLYLIQQLSYFLRGNDVKYYYEKPEKWSRDGWFVAKCEHPLCNRCTLYSDGIRALAIVQEHYDPNTKARWWGSLDPWLAGDICDNPNFGAFFDDSAFLVDNNIEFPVFTVRTVMWNLRMKPLKKESWETTIDKSQKLQLV